MGQTLVLELMTLPERLRILQVRVSATDYEESSNLVIEAACQARPMLVAHAPVHLVVAATRDAELGARIDQFDIVAPDGQPVRWALRALHGKRLVDRVYGPYTMLNICATAAERELPVYLYGSTEPVIRSLAEKLRRRYPELLIAGSEAPPFRPLTVEEDAAVVRRIRASGARIVFAGLGCPKQERFAHEHRESIGLPLVCVGAAFDFIAGAKPWAPVWMQRFGLEWLFRLASEPGRLWQRYLFTNTQFVLGLIAQLLRGLRAGKPSS
jgi:exopolysaccharide biosynthesis WecB/TagA/CpsF family protein